MVKRIYFYKSRYKHGISTIICVKNTEQSMFKVCCAKYKSFSNVRRLLPLDIARYQTNSKVSQLSQLIDVY